MLSGIQHFRFCKRQWALIHIEQQWEENFRTIDGKLMHERAHDNQFREKRGERIISRGMSVFSKTMGVRGVCDIVELIRDDMEGVAVSGREGLYRVEPVEYKRGSPKKTDVDVMQLTAQAICLEEMFCCDVPRGSLYYGEIRHRLPVLIDEQMKKEVREIFYEMHELFERQHTPKVKRTKSCNACSLKNVCLPGLQKENISVEKYILQRFDEM